ncbi:MAG: DUF58 domain-containing protein [Anaerolineae bacterium]|nr:DUF58 domain-containing protein [Anaerolineae bacterium]
MSTQIERHLDLNTRLPLILLALLFFSELVSPARVWMYLLTGVGGLTLIAYVWARQMRDGVHLTRHTHGTWVTVGDVLEERFALRDESFLPVLWAEILDRSTIPEYSVSQVVACGAQGEYRWITRGECRRRGVYTLGPTEVRLGDPFGLFRVVIHYPETETILVYPRVMHLPPLELPVGTASGRARASLRAFDRALLAATVRGYQPGDSLHLVHWPSSAHRGELMVKEFDMELSGNLWVVLDLDETTQAGEGEESTLEYGVVLAASLAAEFLQHGERRSVGLVAFGQQPSMLPPHPGQEQLWRILRVLAGAVASPDWPLERVLRETRAVFGRGQTVAVITSSLKPGWVPPLLSLVQRGLSPVAILVDPGSFDGHASGQEMAALRELLAEHGIPSHVIKQGYPFQPLIRQVRRRVEYKVLGTGRVVPVVVEEEV